MAVVASVSLAVSDSDDEEDEDDPLPDAEVPDPFEPFEEAEVPDVSEDPDVVEPAGLAASSGCAMMPAVLAEDDPFCLGGVMSSSAGVAEEVFFFFPSVFFDGPAEVEADDVDSAAG